MNHCSIHQKDDISDYEEMRSSVVIVADPVSERRDPIVCPKPRRFGHLNSVFNDPIRPPRRHFSFQSEISDLIAVNELLNIKQCGSGGTEQPNTAQVAASPPFFSGSPPSRVANPLIQDAKFKEETRIIQFPSLQQFGVVPNLNRSCSPSTLSASRKGGCVSIRSNFGNSPAVRVVGFDCMARDPRNRSVPAFA